MPEMLGSLFFVLVVVLVLVIEIESDSKALRTSTRTTTKRWMSLSETISFSYDLTRSSRPEAAPTPETSDI
jgi:hypothetical protein